MVFFYRQYIFVINHIFESKLTQLILCDDYRVSLEKQIEIEDEDGNFDEECEEISESGSSLEEIEEIIEYYLEEGGTEESIC